MGRGSRHRQQILYLMTLVVCESQPEELATPPRRSQYGKLRGFESHPAQAGFMAMWGVLRPSVPA
jgi:hypothetical protein